VYFSQNVYFFFSKWEKYKKNPKFSHDISPCTVYVTVSTLPVMDVITLAVPRGGLKSPPPKKKQCQNVPLKLAQKGYNVS